MASRRLPEHLRNVIGPDAEEELVTILDEIRAENAAFRRDVDRRFDVVDQRFDRVDARLATLESRIADVKADLMKWSFGFWVGAVIAVAVLAKLIR